MRYVEVGLLIFLFAFILCFPGEVMVVGEPWRLVAILEANPHFYLGYVWDALLYLILPPAVGVAFIIVGYIKEKKTFFQWQLTVAGGIIVFWGLFGLWRVYASYCDAVDQITQYNIPIGNLLLTIYAALSVAKILWLFAGVLSMHSYLNSTLRNEWSKYRNPQDL